MKNIKNSLISQYIALVYFRCHLPSRVYNSESFSPLAIPYQIIPSLKNDLETKQTLYKLTILWFIGLSIIHID